MSYLSLPVEEKLEVKKNFYEEKYPIQHRSKAAKFTVFFLFFLGGGGVLRPFKRRESDLSPIFYLGTWKREVSGGVLATAGARSPVLLLGGQPAQKLLRRGAATAGHVSYNYWGRDKT